MKKYSYETRDAVETIMEDIVEWDGGYVVESAELNMYFSKMGVTDKRSVISALKSCGVCIL